MKGCVEMGLESYNFFIKSSANFNVKQIEKLILEMGYSISSEPTFYGKYTYEKPLESGFIEIDVDPTRISMRTARANDPHIIIEIIKDMQVLNNVVQIDVFDLQLKQNVSQENCYEAVEKFKSMRNEFLKYYPNVKYPIRCDDVFKYR